MMAGGGYTHPVVVKKRLSCGALLSLRRTRKFTHVDAYDLLGSWERCLVVRGNGFGVVWGYAKGGSLVLYVAATRRCLHRGWIGILFVHVP